MTDILTLTPTMRRCIRFASANGGKPHGVLVRYPGGHWRAKGADSRVYQWGKPSFNTSTVEGLVRRGLAEYTQCREGRNGKFPTEMTLTEKAMEAL